MPYNDQVYIVSPLQVCGVQVGQSRSNVAVLLPVYCLGLLPVIQTKSYLKMSRKSDVVNI